MKKIFSAKRLAATPLLLSEPAFSKWISNSISAELGKGIADVLSNGKEYIVQMRMKQEIPSAELQDCTEVRGSFSLEPLIRCKDRKKNPKISLVGCPMASVIGRTEEDFCSFGEGAKDEEKK